jgi:beta-lactamase class A
MDKKFYILPISLMMYLTAITNAHCENSRANTDNQMKKLEQSFDGKIGVYAIDTNNNQIIAYRADERFPMQSTLKLIGVSALLDKSKKDKNLLKTKIHYTKDDLQYDKKELHPWHPITGKYVNSGMTFEALSAAAISYSDNPAINLIIKKLGGPQVITHYAHSIGNKTFNLKHYEGDLNSNPNSLDDTVTPKDMGLSLTNLALGNALPSYLQNQLITWMTNTTTSYKRIRASAPLGWTVADKTGSGRYGIANDVGMMWSPACKPIVLAIYTIRNKPDAECRDDIVAATAKIILDEFEKNDACFNR